MDPIEITENQLLMKRALESLQGKWGPAVGAAAVYCLISVGANSLPVIGTVISFLISGALWLGWCHLTLSIARGEKAEFGMLFEGFQRYSTALIAYILVGLFTLLWALLLIIPGIMAMFSYAMTFFILLDDETVTPMEAIAQSKEMMRGHRIELFYLMCRFIGWAIVCFVTLGIALLWVLPYFTVSLAQFYEKVSGAKPADQKTTGHQTVDPEKDISDLIIDRVMAMDQSVTERKLVEKEVRETVAALMTSVTLSTEEIEKIAAEVLREFELKK